MQVESILDLSRSPKWRSALHAVRLGILPVALAFLFYLAWSLRSTLIDVLSQTKAIYLVFSVVFWVGAHMASPFLSALSLTTRDKIISYKTAFRIHARNIIARYIPGGVWHTVGRAADFSEEGSSSRRIAGFVFLENGLALSITLALGGASVWFFYGEGWSTIGAISFFAGLVGIVVLRRIVNRWIFLGVDTLSPGSYSKCVSATGLFWAFAVAAFLFYLHAFTGWVQTFSWMQIGGAYLLAWGLGFLAVFAPQGMGVFEVILANLISDSLPLGAVVVIIGGFRLVILVADALVWLAAHFVSPRSSR